MMIPLIRLRVLHGYSASGFTELLTGHKETFGGISTVKQFTIKQKEPSTERSGPTETRLEAHSNS